jgi:hypothetical protein
MLETTAQASVETSESTSITVYKIVYKRPCDNGEFLLASYGVDGEAEVVYTPGVTAYPPIPYSALFAVETLEDLCYSYGSEGRCYEFWEARTSAIFPMKTRPRWIPIPVGFKRLVKYWDERPDLSDEVIPESAILIDENNGMVFCRDLTLVRKIEREEMP